MANPNNHTVIINEPEYIPSVISAEERYRDIVGIPSDVLLPPDLLDACRLIDEIYTQASNPSFQSVITQAKGGNIWFLTLKALFALEVNLTPDEGLFD